MTLKSAVKGFALVFSSSPHLSLGRKGRVSPGQVWLSQCQGLGSCLWVVRGVLLCVWEVAGARCCQSRCKGAVVGGRSQERREQTRCSGCGCFKGHRRGWDGSRAALLRHGDGRSLPGPTGALRAPGSRGTWCRDSLLLWRGATWWLSCTLCSPGTQRLVHGDETTPCIV